MPTLCNICRVTVLSLAIFSQSWAACNPSCFTWASRAAIFPWESTCPCHTATKFHVGDHIIQIWFLLYISPHLPLGNAAMILSSFLENLLALRLLLLIQTALLLQLAELQLLKLLGPKLQSFSFLSKYICSFTSLKDKAIFYISLLSTNPKKRQKLSWLTIIVCVMLDIYIPTSFVVLINELQSWTRQNVPGCQVPSFATATWVLKCTLSLSNTQYNTHYDMQIHSKHTIYSYCVVL